MKIYIVLLIIFLSGCALAPKYEKPVISLPQSEKSSVTFNYKNFKWWNSFHDKKLSFLIENALKNNDDLKLAVVRIEKAYSIMKASEAEKLPLVSGNFNISRNKLSKKYSGFSGTDNLFSPFLSVSYEADLWKKLENRSKYNISKLLAEKHIEETLKINIAANVAVNYVTLQSINKRIEILKDILKKYEDIYRFRLKQYKHGTVDNLVVESSKGEVKYVETLIKSLNQLRVPIISTISVLIGDSPEKLFKKITLSEKNGINILLSTPALPPFIPSEILNNRPDIKTAEENLKAANFKIGIVKAAYFPDITLTGLLGFKSRDLNNLITSDAKFWNIGGSLFQTILDFGRIKANVNIAEAEKKEAVIKYVKTVRNAFKDVYDALNGVKLAEEKIKAEKDYLKSLKTIVSLALIRFNAGSVDYLTVLNEEKTFLTEKLNLIKFKEELLKKEIFFYKALGCGYNADYTSSKFKVHSSK